MDRIFNTIEEAVETWDEEAKKALLRKGFSGIFCKCECYRREDEIKSTPPIKECFLLIPEDIYKDYLKYTDERYKDRDYEFPYVAILSPGCIRVRFYGNGRDDYTTEQNLCKNSLKVEKLLERHLGEKIRLGKNLLVKKSG